MGTVSWLPYISKPTRIVVYCNPKFYGRRRPVRGNSRCVQRTARVSRSLSISWASYLRCSIHSQTDRQTDAAGQDSCGSRALPPLATDRERVNQLYGRLKKDKEAAERRCVSSSYLSHDLQVPIVAGDSDTHTNEGARLRGTRACRPLNDRSSAVPPFRSKRTTLHTAVVYL